MRLHDIASELSDYGLCTTPVVDKRPILKDWVDIEIEETLAQDWSKANGLGLILGSKSGVVCLDIDISASNEKLKEVRDQIVDALPPIYCGISGNPTRIPARLYRFNGERSEKFKYIDCEILADGNQKLIPPSIHPLTKGEYVWVGQPLTDPDDLPELPEFIIELLRAKNEEFRYSKRTGGIELTKGAGRSNHGSHNLLSSYAVMLFHNGYTFEDIVDKCLEKDMEINQNADAMYFSCPSRKEFSSTDNRLNAIKFVGEVFGRNAHLRYDKNEFFKEQLANGFSYREGKKSHRDYLALYNYMKITKDVWYVPESRSFHLWDGCKYESRSEDFVKAFAQKYFRNPVCTAVNEKNAFLDFAKNERQSPASDFVLSDKELINFKNGTYCLKKRDLRPHKKSDKIPYVINYNLTEPTEAPVWSALLDLITCGQDHMKTAIEEFIGYALSGCSYDRFNHILILDGGGSNGKSTLIRVIEHVLGKENVSAVGLESISKERFAGFSLVNKLANFCSEEPKESFAQTGPIKQLTGGDPVMVEEKHKGAFRYDNIAKLVISYNQMPYFPDDSSGMKRRIIIIPCLQDFEKYPERKIKDPAKKIIQSELGAVARRCIHAFEGVMDRGSFTKVSEGDSRLNKMIVDSNPVMGFIEDEINITCLEDDWLTNSQLWDKFKESQGGFTKITKRNFLTRLHKILADYGSEKVKRRVNIGVVRGLSHVKFLD